MRGKYKTKLPNKLHFIDRGSQFLGPYVNTPTALLKEGGSLITYSKDEFDNYIQIKNSSYI